MHEIKLTGTPLYDIEEPQDEQAEAGEEDDDEEEAGGRRRRGRGRGGMGARSTPRKKGGRRPPDLRVFHAGGMCLDRVMLYYALAHFQRRLEAGLRRKVKQALRRRGCRWVGPGCRWVVQGRHSLGSVCNSGLSRGHAVG